MVDHNAYSYKACMETFREISTQLPVNERYGYVDYAMEAITGPKSGMVLEKLYNGIMSRSGINFGKIPNSQGDLTKFEKYKTIVDSLALLHQELDPLKINELQMAQTLHDNLIQLREDFVYGFRNDSQFLKVNYNTMVYSLCEIVNLCIVIYVDALKARTDGKPFKYVPYSNLILVQNVTRFNKMVTSGEWKALMLSAKGGHAFTGTIVMDDNSALGIIGTIIGGGGITGAVMNMSKHNAQARRLEELQPNLGQTIGKVTYSQDKIDELSRKARVRGEDIVKVPGQLFKTFITEPWTGKADPVTGQVQKGTVSGKIGSILITLTILLFLIRALVYFYIRAKYGLRDVLQDQEELLKTNMQVSADNTATSLEKQQKMLNKISGLRDRIEKSILQDDANASKTIKQDNASELGKTALVDMPDAGGFVIG